MNKILIAAGFTMTFGLALATPVLAQGMAAGDTMSGPSHTSQAGMANDTMKMDHKKMAKKTAMKHDAMGAKDGMTGPSSAGMGQGAMSGPGH